MKEQAKQTKLGSNNTKNGYYQNEMEMILRQKYPENKLPAGVSTPKVIGINSTDPSTVQRVIKRKCSDIDRNPGLHNLVIFDAMNNHYTLLTIDNRDQNNWDVSFFDSFGGPQKDEQGNLELKVTQKAVQVGLKKFASEKGIKIKKHKREHQSSKSLHPSGSAICGDACIAVVDKMIDYSQINGISIHQVRESFVGTMKNQAPLDQLSKYQELRDENIKILRGQNLKHNLNPKDVVNIEIEDDNQDPNEITDDIEIVSVETVDDNGITTIEIFDQEDESTNRLRM